jgi:hypothetical protein
VRFGIDERRTLWTDSDAPFSYGPTGTQLGTWVGPGRHRFIVRVVATDGSQASEAVTARVQEPKTDKHAFDRGWWVGYYGRLSHAALVDPPPRNHLPHFTAEMWVNQDSWRTLAVGPSVDHVFSYEYWIRGRTLYLGTAWFFGVPGLGGSSAGWTTAGTFQCEPGAWPARYRWSNQRGPVTGRFNGVNTYAHYVVLTAEKDSCAERRHLLEGTWYSLGA